MAKIRICPKCKQPKLKSAVNVSGWLAPDMYECTNCKYTGRLFIEVEPDEYEKIKDLDFKDIEEGKV
jgi:hypothetical protein